MLNLLKRFGLFILLATLWLGCSQDPKPSEAIVDESKPVQETVDQQPEAEFQDLELSNSDDLSCDKFWRNAGVTENLNTEEYSKNYVKLARNHCKKKLTVLMFMMADNDLSRYALQDLYEIEASFKSGNFAGSTRHTDVIAEVDLAGPADVERLHLFQQPTPYDSELLKSGAFESPSSRKRILSPVVENYKDDGAKTVGQRLKAFLEWGIQRYPSEQYIVVLWGHGQGWGGHLKRERGNSTPSLGGVLFDNFPQNSRLSLPQLRRTLTVVRNQNLNGKPFDLLIHDACLMQTAEVLTELKEEARFILGSTQIQNYNGLPYRRIFYSINASKWANLAKTQRLRFCGEDRACWVALIIPELVRATWNGRAGLQKQLDEDGKDFFTYSAFSSSAVSTHLLPAFKKLSIALKDFLKAETQNGDRRLFLFNALLSVPRFETGTAELGHVIAGLEAALRESNLPEDKTIRNLKRALADLQKALIFASLNYYYGSDYLDGEIFPYGSGTRVLSVWIPREPYEYALRTEEFNRQSRLYRMMPEWGEWMALLFEETPSQF